MRERLCGVGLPWRSACSAARSSATAAATPTWAGPPRGLRVGATLVGSAVNRPASRRFTRVSSPDEHGEVHRRPRLRHRGRRRSRPYKARKGQPPREHDERTLRQQQQTAPQQHTHTLVHKLAYTPTTPPQRENQPTTKPKEIGREHKTALQLDLTTKQIKQTKPTKQTTTTRQRSQTSTTRHRPPDTRNVNGHTPLTGLKPPG